MSFVVLPLSDTHGHEHKLKLPPCDVVVHTGDVAPGVGKMKDFVLFLSWFQSLDVEHKIFVPGNHDFACQEQESLCRHMCRDAGVHFLVHEPLTLTVGGRRLEIFGSPWQPWFHDWAWNIRDEARRAQLWSQIPDTTQLLLTHAPAYGLMDQTAQGSAVGDAALAARLLALPQLEAHVFGHIHEAAGSRRVSREGLPDYLAVNASVCTLHHKPIHPFLPFPL